MSQEQVAREYRIAVSGPPAVGKSALTVRFTQLLFVDEYDPTIEDSYKHYATIDNKNVLLDILDTAGQEDYASMKESYMRRGEGFLLVFSVTSMSSFESIQLFYDQITRVKEDSSFVPIILIGNKTDLEDEREVDQTKLMKFAKSLKIPYIETSAKMDLNVNELFYTVVKMINKGSIVYPFEKEENEKKKKKEQELLLLQQKQLNQNGHHHLHNDNNTTNNNNDNVLDTNNQLQNSRSKQQQKQEDESNSKQLNNTSTKNNTNNGGGSKSSGGGGCCIVM